MTTFNKKTVLVTGATTGLGYEAALQLAKGGYTHVIITGRTIEKARTAQKKLAKRLGRNPFEALALDLNRKASVTAAVEQLKQRGHSLDFVILNAGMLAGKSVRLTAEENEITFASSIIGHHILVHGLLANMLFSKTAKIMIAGSEAARGDVPMMKLVDIPDFAGLYFNGDRTRAVEAIAQARPPYTYNNLPHYAMIKAFVAHWAFALARRLPTGISVYTISPGSAPASNAMRNQSLFVRFMVRAVVGTIGKLAGMGESLPKAASRYLMAQEFSASQSGKFFASKPGKMTGPIVEQTQPHLLDHDNQEAVWTMIENVSGSHLDLTVIKEAA